MNVTKITLLSGLAIPVADLPSTFYIFKTGLLYCGAESASMRFKSQC